MFGILVLGSLVISSSYCQAQPKTVERNLKFTIKTTWNGEPLPVVEYINITLEGVPDAVRITINAPFYDDNESNCKPGMKKDPLWKCEAVETFFLNDKEEYVQIQFSPFGERVAIFFIGERNIVQKSFRSVFDARISGSSWNGAADIPLEYFPTQVRKFNAGSYHGVSESRKFNLLYPADSSVPTPDFHKLRFFQPIDLNPLGVFNHERSSPIWDSIREGKLNFTIQTTWNGKPLPPQDQVNITLDGVSNPKGITVYIDATFYNDSNPECQKASLDLNALWKCEVVEVFFLNEDEEYVEIEFSPYGKGLALFLKGERKYIHRDLLFTFLSSINESKWNGAALIPWEYLPKEVSKFNAFSINGSAENRRYNALYSADSKALQPDFHKLYYFQPIDMAIIRGFRKNNSDIWKTALKGILNFTIATTWNGEVLPLEDRVNITLDGVSNPEGAMVQIKAPFYDDNDPNCKPGLNKTALFMCEAVEIYFLNDKNEYLQIMFSPYGKHHAIFLNGSRNYIRRTLPLDYQAHITGSIWRGSALIPSEYFPAKVTKFNAASFHGTVPTRKNNALYPANDSVLQPDFHLLEFFKPIDINMIRQYKSDYSPIWEAALSGIMNFTIEKTWNGEQLPKEDQINIALSASKDPAGVKIRINSPFYNSNNDSFCLSGSKRYYLFGCEVVEVFFLNDENAYLQIQFSPQGFQFIRFLNGERNVIRRDLPLDFKAEILGSQWEGSAIVPIEYFPRLVTKLNAASMTNKGEERKFNALFPADQNVSNPDFHLLRFFEPVDLSPVGGFNFDYPPLWKSALAGHLNYTITTTWNGTQLPVENRINITLDKSPDFEGLLIQIEAPFHDDNDPTCEPEPNVNELWKCEAVEVYFANDLDEYVQVMFSPFGEHIVKFFKGERNSIQLRLPLDFNATTTTSFWKGVALIPKEYFPYRVTKFNAASIHGFGDTRNYNSLYPADDSVSKPNFHALRFFESIDVSPFRIYHIFYSDVWKSALDKEPENSSELENNKKKKN